MRTASSTGLLNAAERPKAKTTLEKRCGRRYTLYPLSLGSVLCERLLRARMARGRFVGLRVPRKCYHQEGARAWPCGSSPRPPPLRSPRPSGHAIGGGNRSNSRTMSRWILGRTGPQPLALLRSRLQAPNSPCSEYVFHDKTAHTSRESCVCVWRSAG